MRVVVIGGLPWSLVNFRGQMLRTMVERGHEVVACAPDADSNIRSRLKSWDITYRHVPIWRTAMSPLKDLSTLKNLVGLFREVKPDCVLAYTVKPVLWGSMAARIAGVPQTYAMITGLGYVFLEGRTFRRQAVQWGVRHLYRNALKNVNGVFFQNPDDESEFRRHRLMPRQVPGIQINGSGIDLEHFTRQPLPAEPVFLLIARLLGDKGIREYRAAARILRKRYPRARFLLAGGRDSNPSAIDPAEVMRWHEEGDIEYLGELEDVRQALAQCTVYVLPSYREGTPRTVLEAMATGRPIVTTDVPGCRETVEDGVNGYLVPDKDIDSLAEAMEQFILQPSLPESMGKESRRIAEEKYDVHKVNRIIIDTMNL